MSRPSVRISNGLLRGASDGRVDAFLGVPYAASPLGTRRFTAPEPAENWSGERDASCYGPSALQAASGPGRQILDMSEAATSEDCLYLNVWTTGLGQPADRPVLVWIHGGAFVVGSGALPIYDGSALAARGDVVVVTINYRLGPFGWLRSAELGTTGNEGLLDQALALAWVQQEICEFGGDAANVTVVGESAGAISIAAHITRSGPKPFRRAILQSGAHNLILGLGSADRAADRLLDHLGSPSRDELRALPAENLLAAYEAATPRSAGIFYGPLRDGVVVPQDPTAALKAGSAAGIDVLTGSNREEMGFFWGRDPQFDSLDKAALTALVGRMTEPRSEQIVAAYRGARTGRGEQVDNRSIAVAIGSDATFRNGDIELASIQSELAKAWMYLFEWRSPLYDGLVGAAHVLEVPFMFGTIRHRTCASFVGDDPAATELSERMMDGWLAFARTGDPGWEAYDTSTRKTVRFGRESRVDSDPLREERLAWAGALGVDPRRA